jgi:hypothetical protein
MPRLRVTLVALGLTIALSLPARVAQAQVDVRNRVPNAGEAPTGAPPTAPAADTTKPEAAAAADDESDEAKARRQATAQQNADRVARMDLSSLLEVPEIQKELKLTDRQKEQLNQSRQFLQQAGGGRRSERGALRAQVDAAIASILTRSQLTRLRQIRLQAVGPFAVTEQEIAVQLQMTPLQLQQVQTIMQQMEMKRSAARRQQFGGMRSRRGEDGQEATSKGESEGEAEGGGPGPSGTNDPSQEIKEQAIQEIAKVLMSGQRSNFNRMLGPKFDFADLTLSGGDSGDRGGFGGDRGGPGGFGGGDRGGFGGGRGGPRP